MQLPVTPRFTNFEDTLYKVCRGSKPENSTCDNYIYWTQVAGQVCWELDKSPAI